MTSTTSDPISRSGRRMAFAGSLLAGGIAIGTLFSPIGLAGAQDASSSADQSTAESSETDATTAMRERGDRGHRGAAIASETLESLLGLTSDELQAARADGQTLVEIAAAQGVTESELVTALVEEAMARIASAVDAGDLDADRGSVMTENVEARVTDAVNRVPGDRSNGGEGHGMGGKGGRGEGRLLESEVLTELGLDADELRTALEGGSTLGEAAAAQGVAEDDLVAALMAAAEEWLAAALAEGRIDADEAAEKQADLAERIQDRLDGVRPLGDGSGHGGHGREGRPGGAGVDEAPADAES